jgi:hypothetical protein
VFIIRWLRDACNYGMMSKSEQSGSKTIQLQMLIVAQRRIQIGRTATEPLLLRNNEPCRSTRKVILHG